MKRFSLLFFCFLALRASASHIVGGEFELLFLSQNQYRLNLIYYFDLNNNTFTQPPQNARPEDLERTIQVAIFRKSDNVRMRLVTLDFLIKTRVSYTQPICSTGEILTDKLIYTAVINLPDEQYNSPSGYYVVWQRCCRNYGITNIISDQPPPQSVNFPDAAGQTFYLEFPPVVRDGAMFQNSSPKLFPPLNDYACPRKPYYADFAGTDDDGDSLVYTLATPLNTQTAEAAPVIRSAPYPPVRWAPGFNLSNIIGGNPDLKVSTDGFLTVTPTSQGLYVFAVKVEEYRNKIKIGEVRRDFQMLVLERCPVADPPKILGKKLGDTSFTYDNTMSINFTNDVTDANRCIQVQVSDPDASKADDFFRENVSIKAIALNFRKNISDILPDVTSALLTNGSTKTFDICFDKCPPFEGGPFQVGIIAYDDACALPLSDTLRVTVYVEPPDNTNPFFTTPNVNKTIKEGDPETTFAIEGIDLDGDNLTMGLVTDGFQLDKVGMKLEYTNVNGKLSGKLKWDPKCNLYDFTKKTNFMVRIIIEDQDDCNFTHPAIMTLQLGIILPGNNDPLISTDLPPDALTNGIEKEIYDKVEFNIYGTDADNDLLVLRGNGIGYSFSRYNMTFPRITGNPKLTSKFTWNLACEKFDLRAKKDFELMFMVVDSTNKCRFYKSDTLKVKVRVLPPTNHAPVLLKESVNPDVPIVNNEINIELGQQIALALNSNDADTAPLDNITIELKDAQGNIVPPEGYLFEPVTSPGKASTTFTWKPDCSIFHDPSQYDSGKLVNEYTFTFLTRDDRCITPKRDSTTITIIVADIEGNRAKFLPPNVITPNGDAKNDFFAMVREDQETGELISILPPDNCTGQFVSITIYNRWGKEIFQSVNRDFRWYPTDEAVGVYYYTLKYTNKDYKGNISLRN